MAKLPKIPASAIRPLLIALALLLITAALIALCTSGSLTFEQDIRIDWNLKP